MTTSTTPPNRPTPQQRDITIRLGTLPHELIEARTVLSQYRTESRQPVIFVIYDHPTDYPHHVVVRPWHGLAPSRHVILADTPGLARAALPPGLIAIAPHPDDDPKIIGIYL